jgi:hypothetical protein
MSFELEPVEGFDLQAWLAPQHIRPYGRELPDLLHVGDGELSWFVTQKEDGVALEFTSRGGQRQWHGSFSDVGGAVRALMIGLGDGDRSMRRMPRLGANYARGFQLERHKRHVRLTWDAGWAELPAARSERQAVLFTRTVGRSLEDLARSLAATDGRPLFAYTPPPAGDAPLKPLGAAEARAKAEGILRDLEEDLGKPLALFPDDAQEEHGDHWTFWWNSVEYLETRDVLVQLMFGALVVPKDGSLYFILPTHSPDLDLLIQEHLDRG